MHCGKGFNGKWRWRIINDASVIHYNSIVRERSMRKFTKTRTKADKHLLFIIFILLGIYQYGIGKICGFTMVPDEFGYWASAAEKVGYDWSEVASLGSYYSFGYSFVLTPILWAFRDGVSAYRAAVTVNMLLMCVSLFLFTGIIRRLFPLTDRVKQALISGIAVFYPVWIFNMQMTMAEAMLMFLFVLITYLLICFMQKAKIVTAVFLAAALAYIYSVHMRTAGVLIACVITLIIWYAAESPKRGILLLFFVALLIFVTCAAMIKESTVTEVFSNADSQALADNDYSSQWGKIQQIATVCGIIQLVNQVIGKVFYLGLASFGLFYWGMGWIVKRCFILMTKVIKRKKPEVEEWISLFLLLAMTGEILIGSIYIYGSNTVDTLIYGRYDEFLMPVFLLAGIIAIDRSRQIFKGILAIGICTVLEVPILLNAIEAGKMNGLRGYMAAGISYLLKEDNLDVCRFFTDTCILGLGVMFLTTFLIWLSGKGRNLVWLVTGILAVEIIAGLQISNHYTYQVNRSNFVDLTIAEEIFNHAGAEDEVVYLDEGNFQYIDFLQLQLGERTVRVMSADKWNDLKKKAKSVFVIADIDTAYKEQLDELFRKCVRANSFYLYYDGKETV